MLDTLQPIIKRYKDACNSIQTEEATKNALILPFFQVLGYDVFNPTEVVPEYNAELPGTKKGDRVDYVIQVNGEPIILVECKWCGHELDLSQESQLLRYFHAMSARIAILTNGIQYRFYTDLDERHKMDMKPFFQFSLLEINEQASRELRKFSRQNFSLDQIVPAAEELKYTGEMKRYLLDQLNDPSEIFVRFLSKQVYDGMLNKQAMEKFTGITKKAFAQFISERVSDRLTSALKEEKASITTQADTTAITPEEENSKIETTQEEWDAFYIVKAILREKIDPSRIFIRDTIGYCGVLLDDSNRKPLCRFYFNNTLNKSLALFDENKKEVKYPISSLDEIYKFADDLFKTYERHEILTKKGPVIDQCEQ